MFLTSKCAIHKQMFRIHFFDPQGVNIYRAGSVFGRSIQFKHLCFHYFISDISVLFKWWSSIIVANISVPFGVVVNVVVAFSSIFNPSWNWRLRVPIPMLAPFQDIDACVWILIAVGFSGIDATPFLRGFEQEQLTQWLHECDNDNRHIVRFNWKYSWTILKHISRESAL